MDADELIFPAKKQPERQLFQKDFSERKLKISGGIRFTSKSKLSTKRGKKGRDFIKKSPVLYDHLV